MAVARHTACIPRVEDSLKRFRLCFSDVSSVHPLTLPPAPPTDQSVFAFIFKKSMVFENVGCDRLDLAGIVCLESVQRFILACAFSNENLCILSHFAALHSHVVAGVKFSSFPDFNNS